MTSKDRTELFAWIFLPGETEPVVAGRLFESGSRKEVFDFNYGKNYLNREDAIPFYQKELPLRSGIIETQEGMMCPSTLRDSAPDAWGRRVILHTAFNIQGKEINPDVFNEIEYMLRSGSDRIGAIDFQGSATEYIPRETGQASLQELIDSADKIEKGVRLTSELATAIQFGTPVGGARPKALITDNDKKYIAKFSTSLDQTYSIVKAEYIAMTLAKEIGLKPANVRFMNVAGRDVLLVERFDREYTSKGFTRKQFISGLTLFGLSEMQAMYASYETLADIVRTEFANPTQQLELLYNRMVFNVLCGNTDDHARNHGALIESGKLTLAPAYDICPQNRVGQEASQAMRIIGSIEEERGTNASKLSVCLAAASLFQIDRERARSMIIDQVKIIADKWEDSCDQVNFSEFERNLFIGNQFLNPYSYEDLTGEDTVLKEAILDAKSDMRYSD